MFLKDWSSALLFQNFRFTPAPPTCSMFCLTPLAPRPCTRPSSTTRPPPTTPSTRARARQLSSALPPSSARASTRPSTSTRAWPPAQNRDWDRTHSRSIFLRFEFEFDLKRVYKERDLKIMPTFILMRRYINKTHAIWYYGVYSTKVSSIY